MVFSCIIKGIKADLEQQCYNEACGQRLCLCLAWKCQTVFDLQNKLSSFLLFFFKILFSFPCSPPAGYMGQYTARSFLVSSPQ